MAAARGAVESCSKSYRELEQEADALLDGLVSAAESGAEFYRAMDRAEEGLAQAKRLLAKTGDLELNETAIVAERIDEELAAAEKFVSGAALSESQEEWAGEMEKAREQLARLSGRMKKMRTAAAEGEALDRPALLAFRREEKECRKRLENAKTAMETRKHPVYSRLRSAKKRVQLLKSGVAAAMDRLAKGRLRKKIAEAKEEISSFLKNSANARFFVDARHLTLTSGSHRQRIPLTQAVRFALEEIAPLQKPLARLGRGGTVVIGTYEGNGKGGLLRIGERSVAGDSVIYRETAVKLS